MGNTKCRFSSKICSSSAALKVIFCIAFVAANVRARCPPGLVCIHREECIRQDVKQTMWPCPYARNDEVCCLLRRRGRANRIESRQEELKKFMKHKNYNLLPVNDCGGSYIGRVPEDRIHGGNDVVPGEVPWIALIIMIDESYRRKRCGAIVISEWYLLTAAHCVVKHREIWARVAFVNRTQNESCVLDVCRPHQRIPVVHELTHELYRKGYPGKGHDIALMLLQRKIEFNELVKPVCLPFDRPREMKTANLLVSGWGESENNTKILQKMEVKLVGRQDCRASWLSSNIYESQLCALGLYNSSAGLGDSGGPLLKLPRRAKDRATVLGIVSYGDGSWTNQVPTVYTRVAKYLDWVLDNIKK